MIASEPTADTLKRLRAAGFETRANSRKGKGSHTVYRCPHGPVTIAVVTGHRETSPALVRKVNKAIAACKNNCE